MALTQDGKFRLLGSACTLGSAFPGADVTRWTATVTPKEPKVIEVAGLASTVINPSGGEIELSCDVVFGGTDSATALATAALPAPGTNCTLTGITIVSLLGTADALNSGGGKWKFTGANLAAITDDAHTGTVTFKKWIGVTLA